MTIFRYVFLSICAVAELLLFLFGLTGFSVGESAPLGMVLAITVGAAVMLHDLAHRRPVLHRDLILSEVHDAPFESVFR